MFLPLVDTLRCPREHEEGWLVASIDRAADRHILEGTLGCPICQSEYPVRDGIVYFVQEAPVAPFRPANEEDAVRLAAALDLTEARKTAVLYGVWGAHAPLITSVSPSRLLLVNPPEGVTSGDGVSIIRTDRLLLGHYSMDAAAFDGDAGPAARSALVASVRPGGRLLGPADAPMPDGVTELVRDADVWVAQVHATAAPPPISLRRRSV